jgi:hypothetical protein
MVVERVSGGTSLIDVLDRVLDKGIVIDAWVRLSLAGIDLVTVEARIVVASIATYLQFTETVGVAPASASPRFPTFPSVAKPYSVSSIDGTTPNGRPNRRSNAPTQNG